MSDIVTTSEGLAPSAVASNPEDQARWMETSKALNLLDGVWTENLREYMRPHVDVSRLEGWGPPNTSLNLFKMLVQQLNCLYDDDPSVKNVDFDIESEGFFLRLGIWPRMQKHGEYVIGARESAIRIEWTDATPTGIQLRLVRADRIEVECHPSVPTLPLVIRELQLRRIGAEVLWCWDIWDIRDPEEPSYRVTRQDNGHEVTAEALGEEAGKWSWFSPIDGRPFLPWIITHAADSGRMWDARAWHELIQGTYGIAMCWSFWLHALKEASWDQKYAIDVMLQGLKAAGSGAARRSKIAVDPTSLLMFTSKDGRGTVGSVGASVDPLAMAQAILVYQQIVATHLGVSPSDIQTTSDGQSGIAISLNRSGLRKMQRRFKPQFKTADEELCEKIAWIHNIFADTTDLPELPNSGYQVSYPALPLSAEEIDAILTKGERRLALGLISEVDLLIEMEPGLTRDEALARLVAVAEERRVLAAARAELPEGGGEAPVGDPAERPRLSLTSTDIASIVTVNEARAAQGLRPLAGAEGRLTVSEYQAKNATVIAKAAAASEGTTTKAPPTA